MIPRSHILITHRARNQAVLTAFGWDKPSDAGPALALHASYEVDCRPENDRVRYTIYPAARGEFLKRLLKPNNKRYAEEEARGLHKKTPGKKRKPTNQC